ncbi:MAG: flagellar biosynthetic protein FliO [Phycisphaeraceae bacterium]|nr:flagellar biosynthetic protein FliO [Phycisphaeraceae bacterium]
MPVLVPCFSRSLPEIGASWATFAAATPAVPSGDFLWQAVRTFLVLGAVVAVLLIVTRLLARRRAGEVRAPSLPAGGVRVVGGCSIDSKHAVYLVRVEDGPARGDYLVGASDHGLHPLGGASAQPGGAACFEQLLGQAVTPAASPPPSRSPHTQAATPGV